MKYEKEELEKLIKEEKMSYESIGRMYGVTGNAIKKAALRLGIELEARRKINPNENFSKESCKGSKYENFSDLEFIDIIENNIGWKDISNAFGYNSVPNKLIKDRILDKCKKLNISIKLTKPIPMLSRTKGELFSDSKNWQSARSSIRRLAEIIYKNSGKECKCAICGYTKHIEIAHIKAVSEFDDNATIKEINDPNNLVGLCPNHHWEFDNDSLSEDNLKILQDLINIASSYSSSRVS